LSIIERLAFLAHGNGKSSRQQVDDGNTSRRLGWSSTVWFWPRLVFQLSPFPAQFPFLKVHSENLFMFLVYD